ncbi:hypothetical protein ARAM_004619 [Aspergillus rambellii]|uniref:Uncharacterized protein n=1 Tax=Aspergillus rambellii TaxID=308745 RepID=A0A0F8U8Z7_9EURO|nr:hypothetical protein ARAM_004619 [Aspergillus rambellii]
MTKELTFDIHFDSVYSHDTLGEGKQLADRYVFVIDHVAGHLQTNCCRIRHIYEGRGLSIPDFYDSTLTTPPVHFMQVFAPDDVDVEELRKVHVPAGMDIDIIELTGKSENDDNFMTRCKG